MTEHFSGKKVLVTGADGFIGSHLTEALAAEGADVRALVYYNSWNEIGWLKSVDNQVLESIEVVRGDIRDAGHVRELVKGCHYVLHLSSLIAIPYSYLAPRSYVETNIGGALNILEACRASESFIRLVHVSTSEVYGSAQYVPIDEAHPKVAQSPYSATKIGADKLAESYFHSFGLPVVIARPFNTFGPRQTARAVIPTIASQLATGKTTLKLGLLTPTRDFNYVTDTAQGLLALALCGQAEGQVANIGSGEEWSIAQVVEMLSAIAGVQVKVEQEADRMRPQKSEVNRLLADRTKILKLTNWRSQVRFEEGLKKTYEWICDHLRYFDPDQYAV